MIGGRYRLGEKAPATPGTMWDIIRGYVAAEKGIEGSHLLAQMVARPRDAWPARVLSDPSMQGVGSETWCRGSINGAVRKGYLIRY